MDEIVEKARKLGISTYFYNYPSEINNLGGRINIFLNEKQSEYLIKQDFTELMDMFKSDRINKAPIVCPRERGKEK